MALDSRPDTNRQSGATPSAGLSHVAGGAVQSQSSAASGVFYQGDGQNPAPVNSMSGAVRSGLGGVLSSAANSSGPSVGASSLVTDANSGLSGGPQLQRSASINGDSYMLLPASPLSFSSNNISGSSVMDGSSIVQQSPHQEQAQKRGVSSVTSHSMPQEPGGMMRAQKKPRMEMRQEDILQQQMIQQLLQKPDIFQMQGHQNPQLQAMIQHQRLLQRQQQQQQQQQQKMLQAFPQMQCAQIAHPQQQQLRQHLLSQTMQPVGGAKRPVESSICARRVMQYLFHQRHRPADNSISYWKKFVVEYFAPRARKRWCLSLYNNIGNHALGVFPQTTVDAWHCDICGSRSGKGFEAAFEILPRLYQIKFDHGVVDEILFLDMPQECRLPTGVMVLEYPKAIQESVYEHLRVVREGQLRIIFTPELKIMSWEFCARRHEEFLPRRLITPQVNQLLQVAQKCQAAVHDSGSAGVSHQDLQASCNMFVTVGRHLAKNLELQSLNDLGFSKRYVRCLQISEVVNSMKDLIDYSREQKIGPIESLKNYTAQAAAKLHTQKMQGREQLNANSLLPTDQSTLSKIMGIHPGISSHISNNLAHTGVLNNTQQVLNNYHNLLRNSGSTNQNTLQQEASCSFTCPNNQSQPLQFQTFVPSVRSNSLPGSFQQQPPINNNMMQRNNIQSSGADEHMQQHVIQQLLQEVLNNNRPVSQQSPGGPNVNGNFQGGEMFSTGANAARNLPTRMNPGQVKGATSLTGVPNNMSKSAVGMIPSRSNSFKSVGSNPSVGGSSMSSRADLPQHLDLPELDEIAKEFAENGIFSSEPGDMGYGWKM